MQRFIISICIWLLACIAPQKGQTQIPIAEIIKQGVTKIIKAMDLKVQRLQNKIIWLQNVQKVIENSMSKLHLGEITDWVQRQKDLYSDYYNSLSQVNSVITYYHQIKDISISTKQAQLVAEYKHGWSNMQQDKHFTVRKYWKIPEIINDQLQIVIFLGLTQSWREKYYSYICW